MNLTEEVRCQIGYGGVWGVKGKGKGRTLVIAPLQAYQPPQRRSGTWRAQSSVAHTCLYAFL